MASWWLRAKYIECCNCDHGCPCNLTQVPTYGGCNAVVGYHITEGECDGVDLSGLTLGYVASWPGAIHEGDGHAAIVVDERADEAQRRALEAIGSGRAGPGGPFEIFAATMAEPPEVIVAPIEFELEGKSGRLRFGDVAESSVGPIRGAMEGAEANARMLLPEGFVWQDALLVNTESGSAKTSRIDFTIGGSNAFFSEVAYNV